MSLGILASQKSLTGAHSIHINIKKEESILLPEVKSQIKNLNCIPEENESLYISPTHYRATKSKESDLDKPRVQILTTDSEGNRLSTVSNKHSMNKNVVQPEIFKFLLGKGDIEVDFQDIMKHKLTTNPKKTNYLNEKNLYLGDLVIVFPNPDTFIAKKNTTDLMKVLKTFHKTFETDFNFFDRSLRDIFFFAFLQAYEKLKTPGSKGMEGNTISPPKAKKFHMKEKSNINSENDLLVTNLMLNLSNKNDANLNTISKNFTKSNHRSRRDSYSPTKENISFNKATTPHSGFIKETSLMVVKENSPFIKENSLPVENSPFVKENSTYLKENSPQLKNFSEKDEILMTSNNYNNLSVKGLDNPNVNFGGIPPSRKVNSSRFQHNKYSKTKSIKKEFEKEIIKKIKKGGVVSLEKITTKGEFLKEYQEHKWKQNSMQIVDFFSLMRNSVLYKLAFEAGFKTRSFMDTKGEHIFTVLYSCDENLQITAELDMFNKQVSLARTDILSLEPVDRKLRPIRFNIRLKENDALTVKDGKYFTFVKPMILKLLHEINYKRICRELHIPGGDETVEILEDAIIPDELWRAYYEYLTFLRDGVLQLRKTYKNPEVSSREVAVSLKIAARNSHKKKKGKTNKMMKIHNGKIVKNQRRILLAQGYEKLFLRALEIVNSQFKKKMLLTIWDHSGMTYQEAFFDYIQTPNRMSFRVKNKIDAIWKRYQVTEKGTLSLFTRVERLKLAFSTIQKFVNIAYLIDNHYITEIFALNDMMALGGISMKELLGLDANFLTLSTKALSIRRASPMRRNVTKKVEDNNNTTENDDGDVENEILKQRYNNLILEWKFDFTRPTFVPVEMIRNYYGEKIALYFQFLSHYTKYLTFMAIVGMIFTIVYYDLIANIDIHFILDVFICISLGIWSNAFVLRWRRKELLFAIKYGQLDFEHDEQERSLFHGTCKRSLSNDQMNVLSYSNKKKYSKIALAWFLSLVLIVINMVFAALFFELVVAFYQAQVFVVFGFLRLDIVIPAFLNNMLNQFFTEIFTSFALKYTKFENHRTLSLFESSFIMKKFIFSLVVMVTPLAFISFLNQFNVFGMECVDTCALELMVYLRTYYIFTLFTNLWEIIKPKLQIAYNNYKERGIMSRNNTDRKRTYQSQFGISPDEIQKIENRDKFIHRANKFLEKEFRKTCYSESQDVYGTVEDYMEICLNYAMLALFGIGDPLVFFIALVSMIVEMQTDKHKLMNYTKRPIPLGERTIGIWLDLMEFVANVSVLTNSGIIAFTYYDFSSSESVILFVILILVSYTINWVLNSIFEEIPGNMARIMKRHQLLQSKTINGNGVGSSNPIKISTKYPIFKVFNTKIIIEGENFFEDMNTLDYMQEDRGVMEENKRKSLKHYRKEFRRSYFKEFRWNPHMTTKPPGVILQELNHRKKKRSKEFRKSLLKLRKKHDIPPLRGLGDTAFQSSKGFKISIRRKKKVEDINTSSNPSEFLTLTGPKAKQLKLDNLSRYLNLEFKHELSEKNGRNAFVDLGLNSNEFLRPNDLEFCLSISSRRIIESKKEHLPLAPYLKFHELIFLEKSLVSVFHEFPQTITLKTKVFYNKTEEIWLGGFQNAEDLNLAIKINEIDEEYENSKEYLSIRKYHKTLLHNNMKQDLVMGFLIRKRFFFDLTHFDLWDQNENSRNFKVEVFECGELLDSQGFQEISLRNILEKRNDSNDFYNEREILYFLENFLGGLQMSTRNKPELFLEINLDNVICQVRDEQDVLYFFRGPEIENMGNNENFKEMRAMEFNNVAKTLIIMICLNKLKIDWEDTNALAIILETFAKEYPKAISVISRLFSADVELAGVLMHMIEEEEKLKPKDYYYLNKITKKRLINSETNENSSDLVKAYVILGNEKKALEILRSIPQENKDETLLFIEVLANFKSDNSSLESFEEVMMAYLEKIQKLYEENDRREIKVYYYLASKALELKKFKKAITYLTNLWRIFQVNCLKENLPALLKFYELQGMTYNDNNMPGEAIKSFEQFRLFSEGNTRNQAKARLYLAQIDHQIGKPIEALEHLNSCLEDFKKLNEPQILLVYGFLAKIYLELGQTIKASFFSRKAYKWFLKHGIIRSKEIILRVIEFSWAFPELFETFPQDIRTILLSTLDEFCEEINNNNGLLEVILRLALAKAYYFHNWQRSYEIVDMAEKALKPSEGGLNLDILKKKLYGNKFLYFTLELKLFLLLKLKDVKKTSLFDEILKEMDDIQDFQDLNLNSMKTFNRSFLLYLNEKSSDALDLLHSFIKEQKKKLSLISKAFLYDFLCFLSTLEGEKNCQDHWIEMLECYQGHNEWTLLGYIRLTMSLIMLKRFDKAIGFLEYLQQELEKQYLIKEPEFRIDIIIMQFDVAILSAICQFHNGNFVQTKKLMENAYEMNLKYSKKENNPITNEKMIMAKFFRKFFKDRSRNSFLLNNLAKINAILDNYDKAYYIFNKCFRSIREDFTHIKYSLKQNSKPEFLRNLSKKSQIFIKETHIRNLSKPDMKLQSSGCFSESKESKMSPPSKEEEILAICLQCANPSNSIIVILNLVKIQMMTFKYNLAIEALEKIEKVLENLEEPGILGICETITEHENDLKLVGYFCQYLLVKAFFYVGQYDKSLEKFQQFKKNVENSNEERKDSLNYVDAKGFYWVKELSGWLNCEIFRDFDAGFADFHFCLQENPKFFGEKDASLLGFYDNLIKVLVKGKRNIGKFEKTTKYSAILFQIKENLIIMQTKYQANSRLMTLVYKALGNIEASQKNYFPAIENFNEALKFANDTNQAKHLVGEVYLDIAQIHYKQLKLLEAEKIGMQTLEHYKKFCHEENCNWELCKIHFFLAKISLRFTNMVEENIEFLNTITDVDLGKWEKHFVEIKLWEEDFEMLRIFEEFRESKFLVYLTKKLKGTFDEFLIEKFVYKQASRNFKRYYLALEHLDRAIFMMKGRINPENKVYKRIEEKLINLKYKHKVNFEIDNNNNNK